MVLLLGGFTIFDKNKLKTGATIENNLGDGFYFTTNERDALNYSKKGDTYGQVYKEYLNITNPFVVDNKQGFNEEQAELLSNFSKKIAEEHKEELDKRKMFKYETRTKEDLMNLGRRSADTTWVEIIDNYGSEFSDYLKELGYDGIIHDSYSYNTKSYGKNFIVFNPNQIKNIDNTNPTNNPDIRYSVESTTDNQGNKLSKGQQEFFKDVSPEELVDGKIPLVFHTTTDNVTQFNEFNPVGTPYYRFGDQVVNYFTDSKDMSGSYANNRYEMADTTKLNTFDEARQWLKSQGSALSNYEIKENNGRFTILDNGSVFGNIGFENEQDLLRNLKSKFNEYRENSLGKRKNKIQYQGYVKLTNPYVIDAKGKNWDTVTSKIDKAIEKEVQDIKADKQLVQDLIELAVQSDEKHTQYTNPGIEDYSGQEEFNLIDDFIKDLGRGQSQDFKSSLEDTYWFGFNYDNYIKDWKEAGIDLPDGNKKIREIIQEYADKHDINDIKRWSEKLNLYGSMTLNDFLKQANKIYEKNLEFGKESSYFEKNYRNIFNKESTISPNQLYRLAKGIFSNDAVLDILGERQSTNDIVKHVLEMNKNGANYDGVIMKNVLDYGGNSLTRKPANLYVTFNSNQFKAQDNLNPTNDADIRYSQDTAGAWNNFIEKYFKTEGTGTAIKDMKKLPTKQYTRADFENLIDSFENISDDDRQFFKQQLDTEELTENYYTPLKTFLTDLDNEYVKMKNEDRIIGELPQKTAEQKEMDRFARKLDNDTERQELINKKKREFYKGKKYDDSIVTELDESRPRNRNGKRTVKEWKNIAKTLGEEIANMTPEQIEDIAVKSYYDLLGGQLKDNITRYDNVNKRSLPFERLYANDWVNSVYEGVRAYREFSLETEDNTKNNDKNVISQETTAKQTQTPLEESPLTTIDEDLEAFAEETAKLDQKGKSRKHYRTYANTESITPEANKVAKKLYKTEQYIPISNTQTLTKANSKIERGGTDNTYIELTNRFNTNDKMTLQDIATGERLIQIYSAKGDYAKVNELMQDIAILGTELGQQVQALSIIKRASPEGQLRMLQRLIERTNNKENTDISLTDEQTEKILKSKNEQELKKNVSEVTEQVAEQLPVTMKDKLRSWRYLSMLGNPRTHIRNLGGNVAMNILQNVKNRVAGAGEDVASLFNKNLERTQTLKFANQDQKDYAKIDAFKLSDFIDDGGKYSADSLLERNKKQFSNRVLNAIGKANSWLLEKEDKIFLTKAYEQALKGYMVANNLSSKDMESNQKVANKARQYARDQALEATFHQYNALASTLNQVEQKGGALGFLTSAVLPFKKTPMNIASTGIQYSPVGIMQSVGGTINDITKTANDLRTQLNKGTITQEQYNSEISDMVNHRIDQMAKGLTGTAIGVLGYVLSNMGVLKATNKDDDDEFEESLGKQEFSIQIGDNTYSLDWLSPTAIPLFIGANIQEMLNEDTQLDEDGEEKTWYDKIGDTATSVTTGLSQAFEPMTEMSMLQGLASAISSYEQDSSNKIFDILSSSVQSYLGQYMPTAVGQVAKTIDPVVRDTSSTKKGTAKKIDQLVKQTESKIPFVSKNLPAKSDIWGEDKKRADNPVQRFLETAVLPYNREKIIEDMTSEKLKDVFRDAGGKKVLPSAPQKYFTYDKKRYNFTSKEYNQAKKTYGQTAKSVLDNVIRDETFNGLDNEIKTAIIEDIYTYAKGKVKENYLAEHNVEGYDPRGSLSKKKYEALNAYIQNKNLSELLKVYTTK